jgi:hypothetical protein
MKQGNIDMSAQTMSRDIHIHRKTAAPHTKHQNIYIYNLKQQFSIKSWTRHNHHEEKHTILYFEQSK